MSLVNSIVGLYKKVTSSLPDDVWEKLKEAKEKEENSVALNIFKSILENVILAKEKSLPICQDTGTPIFYVNYKKSQKEIAEAINEATKIATKENYLRPNAVDPISGENIGNFPKIYFNQWNKDFLQIDLMLKGGGSENIGMIYSLPDLKLNANRDVSGIKKCVVDAMFKAQGNGCSPNILGIGIGGSRVSSIELAEKQLLRKLNDVNEDNCLASIEKEFYEELNKLGIGPMGLGGNTTVLGVKIAKQLRHPACFFVAISFMCWACRRGSITINNQ